MKVEALFSAMEEKLGADFKHLSGNIEHSASKGRWREAQVVEQFLSLILPRNLGVAHGAEIVAVDQETSAECDVVIYDPAVPPLLESASFRVLPVETVFGVVEVKSQLNLPAMESSFKKLVGIKRLEKKAFLSTPVTQRPNLNLYGESWPYFPVATFMFAFDSTDLRKLGRKFAELQATVDARHRVDAIWVLKRGYIGNIEGDPPDDWRAALTPRDDTGLMVVEGGALVHMALQMQTLFQFAWQPGFKLLSYLAHEGATFGTPLATLARVSVADQQGAPDASS